MAVVVITKSPQIVFGFSKTRESDCESIKITFTDGLVTQFLLEWSCNELGFIDVDNLTLGHGSSQPKGNAM